MNAVPPRLTIVTQYYPPDVASTGVLLHGIARKLAERGIAVRVLTMPPGYHAAGEAPRRETLDGVDVRRIASIKSDKNRLVMRKLRDLSFAANAAAHLLAAPDKGPLLLVTCPPEGLWTGWPAKLFTGRPVHLLIYDLYPEVAETVGVVHPGNPFGEAWRAIDRFVFRRADSIITLGDLVRDYIADLYLPLDMRKKVVTLPAWTDGDRLRPIPKDENPFVKEHGLADRFVVLTSGNLGRFQEFESILHAAEILSEKDPEVLFLFIGAGQEKPRLEELARTRPNLRVMDFVPEDVLPYSLTSADLALVGIKPGTERTSVPSRAYAYMAAGRPILAVMRPFADTAHELRAYDCGVQAGYDGEEIARRILELKADPIRLVEMGKNARRAYEKHYTLDHVAGLFYEHIFGGA